MVNNQPGNTGDTADARSILSQGRSPEKEGNVSPLNILA